MGSLVAILLIPQYYQKAFRRVALYTTLLQGIGMIVIIKHFAVDLAGSIDAPSRFQFVEELSWIRLDLGSLGTLSVDYLVGIDGLNIGLLMLAIIILIVGVVASWDVQSYAKAYFSLYLLLDTLLIGSFVALDLMLFYIFFESILIPTYFLIAFWGSTQHLYAATKFLLYNLLGTILILAVFIGLGVSVYDPVATGIQTGLFTPGKIVSPTSVANMVQAQQVDAKDIVHSWRLTIIADPNNFIPGSMLDLVHGQCFKGHAARLIAFFSLLIGFLIKIAAVPFHTWLPSAHVVAPTPVSVVLAAAILKVGGYGLLRIAYNIFPEGAIYYSFWIGLLGLVCMNYAALNALAMQDLKYMVAYSSIAHMGFFLLGLASVSYEGIYGALYQMISHGLISAMLFLVAGVIDDRTNNRDIANYSGLVHVMPRYATIAIIAFLAAMGVPGFSGFIAELLILLGAIRSCSIYRLWPTWMFFLGVLGILLNATYFIWTIQRMFLGKFSLKFSDWKPALRDLGTREYGLFILLMILILALGIFPHLLLNLLENSVRDLVTTIHQIGRANLERISLTK